MNGASTNGSRGSWHPGSHAVDVTSELVNCVGDFVAIERGDDAFDLPPVAETDDVPVAAAARRASCRLDWGLLAIALDKVGRVGKCHTIVNERAGHAPTLRPRSVSGLPTKVLNTSFTMRNGSTVELR